VLIRVIRGQKTTFYRGQKNSGIVSQKIENSALFSKKIFPLQENCVT
jgi:hypothetical protein